MSELLPSAVVFDCDGILVDTEPLHYRAFQEVLQPLGIAFDYGHYMERYIGFDDREAFGEAFREGGRPLPPQLLNKLIMSKTEALQRIVLNGLGSFPGVERLVRELQSLGVPLAVASGALGHEIAMFLDALKLRDAFPVIVAADDVKRSKPDPETYTAALRKIRDYYCLPILHPESCVAIEDTPAGIRSALGAGLLVIGVTNSFPAEQLEGADLVVSSLEQLEFSRLTSLSKRRQP